MNANSTPAPSPAVPAEAGTGTREVILDAAERLFSRSGFEGTSVRDIIREAGVNLGAINYHFGTKERLAVEVYARRLAPVNRERVARLDALEAEALAGRGKMELAEVIDAIVRPAVESETSRGGHCDDLMRLLSRCFQEPNPELKKFVEAQFAEVAQRFDSAILKAVPGLPPEELYWRMNFLFGALHRGQEIWLRYDQMPRPQGTAPAKPDLENFIQSLVYFATAGLSASFPGASPAGRRSTSPTPL